MAYNGLLLVDKSSGCTSHDVVADVRRILGQKAVGHSGTLDPLASGLMVLLLGQATKLSNYILSADKRYLARLKLGVTTDSGDREGAVLSTHQVKVRDEDLDQALQSLVGEFELPVPMISAVKVQGQKLYEYARRDQPIEPPKKLMYFYDFKHLNRGEDWIEVEISCSKGGYIRSWATALGEKLGCGAIVEELRRLKSMPYQVADARTIGALEEWALGGRNLLALGPAFVPMTLALPEWRLCSVRGREEQLLRHGQISRDLMNRLIVAQKDAHLSQSPVGIKVVGGDGELVGLIEALPSQGLKIRRIFAHGEP